MKKKPVPQIDVAAAVADALLWLKRKGTRRNVEGMARYGIRAKKVFGVSVGDIGRYAKPFRRQHALALALWRTGWYEARLMAAFVADPERLTAAQMDRWCKDFENWADCDHACFHLFDKSPHAWGRVRAWATKKGEFEKRAAFALIASLALHDRTSPDAPFVRALPLIARGATDERNFVKKGVSWALRGICVRRPAVKPAALKLARTLAASSHPAERWVGKDVLRQVK
jgi:3-methyladenine DNA glycosylase AlkD